MIVIKRDGSRVEYDQTKIANAIKKASNNFYLYEKDKLQDSTIDIILKDINSKLLKEKVVEVEKIQDLVIDELNVLGFNKLAKAYSDYRQEHSYERIKRSSFMKEAIKKLEATDVQNQNANVDEYSYGGRKGEAASSLCKYVALTSSMPKWMAEMHNNNEIYIHDLDSYATGQTNCDSIPFDQLLKYGFKVRQTDIRPANSINTAFQLLMVIFQIQSLQQYGGCSATHVDTTMVPYFRKSFYKHYKNICDIIPGISGYWLKNIKNIEETSIDDKIYKGRFFNIIKQYIYKKALKLTLKETKQAIEGMYHNANSLMSRSGNQLPFTSINYGIDTTKEGRYITKILLEGSINGVGKFHRTPIFPCGIFQLKQGINEKPGDPNYDLKKLAIKSTIKRLYPNYANLDWSNQKAWVKEDRDMKKEVISHLDDETKQEIIDFIKKNPKIGEKLYLKVENNNLIIDENEQPTEIFGTMGCRTVNGSDTNFNSEYYLKQIKDVVSGKMTEMDLDRDVRSKAQKDGRGNIDPCTIILPTIAMETKENLKDNYSKIDLIEAFLNRLEHTIELAKDGLIERYRHSIKQDLKAAKFIWENGSFAGYKNGDGLESYIKHGTLVIGQLGLAECLQILIGKNQLSDEGMELAKRIEKLYNDKCKEFKKEYHLNFGVYYSPCENCCYTAMKKFQKKYGIIPNVSDREYFTNSMHVPVWEKIDPFKKIDIESQLTGYSNAGCITYIEIGDSCLHNEKALEQFIDYAMKKDIPYFAINLPNDMCEECGYQGEIKEGESCPVCGEKVHISRLRRITGYLGTDWHVFNPGKRQEQAQRYHHTDSLSNNFLNEISKPSMKNISLVAQVN